MLDPSGYVLVDGDSQSYLNDKEQRSRRVVAAAPHRFVAAMRTVNTEPPHTIHITQFFMRTCAPGSRDRPDHNP